MIHSGGATLSVQPGKVAFTVTSTRTGRWSDPYITVGYDVSLNSELCNSRVLPGSGGKHGQSYVLPARLGRTGRIMASVHDVTSADFRGDTGFDIWFEPSPGINRYNQMANQGAAATEIMIWLSHPGLPPRSSALRYYPVIIDGRHWRVAVQLASRGHGKTAAHPNGWNLVTFIAPQVSEGNVSVHNLFLNPFFSYAIARHWLRAPRLPDGDRPGSRANAGHDAGSGLRPHRPQVTRPYRGPATADARDHRRPRPPTPAPAAPRDTRARRRPRHPTPATRDTRDTRDAHEAGRYGFPGIITGSSAIANSFMKGFGVMKGFWCYYAKNPS